jgi:hypothetical protein
MRGGARGTLHMPYTPPCEALVTAASQPKSEALAVRVVLAHPHVMFHLCTCGLRGGAAAVAVALIGYDHKEVAAEISTWRRQS